MENSINFFYQLHVEFFEFRKPFGSAKKAGAPLERKRAGAFC
jgi:hypothetical protein